jgi:tetratricopeptide (TPR) repeat protein
LNRLGDVGRREDALTAIEEATGLYRILAAARPDAHTPDLAISLNNLSGALTDLGRREDALTAIEEANCHYRALAATHPDAFIPYLADSLQSYGIVLTNRGRDDEAIRRPEAVNLYWELFRSHPGAPYRTWLVSCGAAGRWPWR